MSVDHKIIVRKSKRKIINLLIIINMGVIISSQIPITIVHTGIMSAVSGKYHAHATIYFLAFQLYVIVTKAI